MLTYCKRKSIICLTLEIVLVVLHSSPYAQYRPQCLEGLSRLDSAIVFRIPKHVQSKNRVLYLLNCYAFKAVHNLNARRYETNRESAQVVTLYVSGKICAVAADRLSAATAWFHPVVRWWCSSIVRYEESCQVRSVAPEYHDDTAADTALLGRRLSNNNDIFSSGVPYSMLSASVFHNVGIVSMTRKQS